jgi:beta-galactosidase
MAIRRLLGLAGLAAALASWAALSASNAMAAEQFPPGFLWGTGTAGFQVEGGKGRNADPGSDWYVWTHDPGNIADGIVSGDQPENGPGEWQHFRQDLDLAARDLHNNAFRLSIEWSRIFPRSTEGIDVGSQIDQGDLKRLNGIADQTAVRHYRKELEAAQKRGLTPFLTLEHFTLPTWLHDPIATQSVLAGRGPNDPLPQLHAGGWLSPGTVDEFRKYAAYLAWKLGDDVDYWNTLNEPVVQVAQGYVNVPGLIGANFPPGVLSFTGAIAAVRNLEAANTVAYNAIKRFDTGDADRDGVDSQVGPVMNMIAWTPANPSSAADQVATRHADYLFNRLFLNAVVHGDVDANADGVISPAEHNVHGRKGDFIGVNYYFRGRAASAGASLTPAIPILDFIPATSYASPADPSLAPCPTTCSEFGSELYPQGFRRVIDEAASYALPIYVTENGIADSNDDQRPSFLTDHLHQLWLAINQDHADVRGYFHWSLVDNLEWVSGYQPKFGLYSFDPHNLKRTPRPSAALYGRVAAEDALP